MLWFSKKKELTPYPEMYDMECAPSFKERVLVAVYYSEEQNKYTIEEIPEFDTQAKYISLCRTRREAVKVAKGLEEIYSCGSAVVENNIV